MSKEQKINKLVVSLQGDKITSVSAKLAGVVLCLVLNLFSLRAQAQFKYKIYFPFDDARLVKTYLSNEKTLESLDSMIRVCNIVPGDSLEVFAFSSPEGKFGYNYALSTRRANTLRDYLLETYPEYTNIIVVKPNAEAWEELKDKISGDKRLSANEKREILRIIESDDKPDKKEKLLTEHPSWKSLYKRYFKHLRYAYIVLSMDEDLHQLPEISYDAPEQEDELIMPEFEALAIAPLAFEKIAYTEPGSRKAKWLSINEIAAVKTNLLYDAVTALNVEVEIPIARRWSVMVEDVFPWWETGNKYCFQMWEMGVEGRYWFKPWPRVSLEKMRGFFAGVYGMSSKYDFQFDRDINYQGEYWSAGLSGGYVMPLGKKKRWNLEFSLALGYLQTDYRHYMPTDQYDRLIRDKYKVGRVSYFGPTKAKVSLVLPIYWGKRIYE